MGSRVVAIEKLQWYALGWKVEVFHKMLNRAAKLRNRSFRTARRLANVISAL